VAGGTSINLQVLDRGGVPADPAVVGAVVLNITVVNPTQAAFITVWPTGEPRPLASSTNVVRGQVVANTVIAKVGANGSVSLFNSDGSVDLLADVVGWVPK